jgi:hypothetical protein
MRILSPKIHGVIDYVTVLGLVLAAALFGHGGISTMLAYALAGIHLVMTVLTAFPLGLIKVIPFKVHGMVELVVGIALVVLPWVLSGTVEFSPNGRMFFSAFGAVLIVVWLTTDYGAQPA